MPTWEVRILRICSKAKYIVHLMYLVGGGQDTPLWCILCICFKVKYTVYLVYLQVCMCVFPIQGLRDLCDGPAVVLLARYDLGNPEYASPNAPAGTSCSVPHSLPSPPT